MFSSDSDQNLEGFYNSYRQLFAEKVGTSVEQEEEKVDIVNIEDHIERQKRTCFVWEELSREYVRRKKQHWPLHVYTTSLIDLEPDSESELKDMAELELRSELKDMAESTDCVLITNKYCRPIEYNFDFFNTFTYIQGLLDKYYGKLVVCGGFFSSDCLSSWAGPDVDIFFYDCTEDEANDILLGAIAYLAERFYADKEYSFLERPNVVKIQVERKINVTNVVIIDTGRKNRHDEELVDQYIKYQFIHRIYPTIGHILGGFDLPCCAIAYDGVNFLTTDLGKWTLDHQTIIVDISRRSTTFAARLKKYWDRGFNIILPGLNVNTEIIPTGEDLLEKEAEEEKTLKDKKKQIIQFARQLGLKFIGSYGSGYDGSYCTKAEDHIVPIDNAEHSCSGYRCRDIIVTKSRPTWKPRDERSWKPELFRGSTPKKRASEEYTMHYSDYGDWVYISGKIVGKLNTSCIINGKFEAVTDIIFCGQAGTLTEPFSSIKFISSLKKAIMDPRPPCSIPISSIRFTHTDYTYPFRVFGPYANEIGKNIYNTMVNQKLSVIQYDEPEITEAMRKTDELLLRNLEKCVVRMTHMSWMTQDPQRQWTASVNPQVLTGKEFYGEKYTPFYVIIHPDVETLLRLANKHNIGVIGSLPLDVLKFIIQLIPFV